MRDYASMELLPLFSEFDELAKNFGMGIGERADPVPYRDEYVACRNALWERLKQLAGRVAELQDERSRRETPERSPEETLALWNSLSEHERGIVKRLRGVSLPSEDFIVLDPTLGY